PHVLDGTVIPPDREATSSRPMLLFFGTMRANKGLDVLADALTALGPAFEADVVIAGTGDASVIAMLQRTLGAHPNVRLEIGGVDDARKRQLFSTARWLLLPYTSFHSQSGVLADAYAYRVPLAVTDVGAIGPTVRADATGLVVPPGNADAFADA